ncbi:MAG: hypothetical protein HOI95_08075 [Chromatiales bacterium]|jgi:Xaa-Pro dipeptidase|nr:hypothetical protein [Chromatiales bacterium]
MTIGVGGSTMAAELAAMASMRGAVAPIDNDERNARLRQAQGLMAEQGVDALYLVASTSCYYFTGMRLRPSERLHGAILTADGELTYLCPTFEAEKTAQMMVLPGDMRTWEEHEDPTALVVDTLRSRGIDGGTLAVDETTPFFTFDALRRAGNRFTAMQDCR